MFRHPARAVGSYSCGPPAARSARTKSTGGCYHAEQSPCIIPYGETNQQLNYLADLDGWLLLIFPTSLTNLRKEEPLSPGGGGVEVEEPVVDLDLWNGNVGLNLLQDHLGSAQRSKMRERIQDSCVLEPLPRE